LWARWAGLYLSDVVFSGCRIPKIAKKNYEVIKKGTVFKKKNIVQYLIKI